MIRESNSNSQPHAPNEREKEQSPKKQAAASLARASLSLGNNTNMAPKPLDDDVSDRVRHSILSAQPRARTHRERETETEPAGRVSRPSLRRRRRRRSTPTPTLLRNPKQPTTQTKQQRLIIYPAYIDALKTVAEGRRIPKAQACPDPHVIEMRDAALHLGLKAEAEDKAYPRDWLVRGRLRVSLFDEDNADLAAGGKGTPYNPEITTRRDLLIKLADLVKRHPSQIEKAAHRARAAAKAGAGSSKSAGGGGKASTSAVRAKRGAVKACHMPILDEIARATAAMQAGGGPMDGGDGGGGEGGSGGGGGKSGGGGGGGGKKKSSKKK